MLLVSRSLLLPSYYLSKASSASGRDIYITGLVGKLNAVASKRVGLQRPLLNLQ